MVLDPLFCDQSMRTLPGRADFVIRDTTSRGSSRSNRCAYPSASSLACSAVRPLSGA